MVRFAAFGAQHFCAKGKWRGDVSTRITNCESLDQHISIWGDNGAFLFEFSMLNLHPSHVMLSLSFLFHVARYAWLRNSIMPCPLGERLENIDSVRAAVDM